MASRGIVPNDEARPRPWTTPGARRRDRLSALGLELHPTTILGVEGVESAEVQLTFDPPWTPERIAPLIRSSLGL